MTLEEMLRTNANEWGVVASEYIVRVQRDLNEDGLQIYIRPSDRGGDTLDLIVKGDDIKIPDWDKLNKINF